MKKTLVSALTTALVVGATATTFAAANPFEDVPADHWAYDAVAQLAADGVIEGYGDGTYRGDQEITRYEMAQMVARAMAKGGNGADKALIDKLAAEFADELNSLGVRVANLEKKVDNVKWLGTVRYRYINNRHEGLKRDTVNYLTLRMEPEMAINDHWTGHARIDYNTDMKSARNMTGANEVRHYNYDESENSEDGLVVERIWAEGNYGTTNILLGKLPYVSNVDNGMIWDDNLAGAQVTFGNENIKATVSAGRAYDCGIFDTYGVDGASKTASYQGIEIYNDREKKFTWGLGYHRFSNKKNFHNPDYNDDANKDSMNIWEVGLGYKFTDLFAINGAFAWNTSADTNTYRDAKRAWTVELDYRGADPEKRGSYGIFAAYRKIGIASVWAPTYDAFEPDEKGWEFGVDYVFAKNIMGTLKYGFGKNMNRNTSGKDKVSTLFYEMNFFF